MPKNPWDIFSNSNFTSHLEPLIEEKKWQQEEGDDSVANYILTCVEGTTAVKIRTETLLKNLKALADDSLLDDPKKAKKLLALTNEALEMREIILHSIQIARNAEQLYDAHKREIADLVTREDKAQIIDNIDKAIQAFSEIAKQLVELRKQVNLNPIGPDSKRETTPAERKVVKTKKKKTTQRNKSRRGTSGPFRF